MLVKHLTHLLSAQLPCSTRKGLLELCVVVRGTFALASDGTLTQLEGIDQGFLSGETLTDEDDRKSELAYPGDFADLKLNGEVLLRGTCHPPRGARASTCPVRFAVGALSKSLLVTGPRARGRAPAPFSSMPLRWSNAFGGPSFAQNPAGKGLTGPEWPTVLWPGDALEQASSSQRPAGFGPTHRLWAPRAGKLGSDYGRAWRRERAPYPATDLDFTYHHVAPADQQLKGYLRGDEEVILQNLHPEVEVLRCTLPGLRPRVFVHDERRAFREVTLVLDTLYVDLDEPEGPRLYLTWRGRTPVATDDLSDVTSALVAAEPLGERPHDAAWYRELLLAFERDPVGLEGLPGEANPAGAGAGEADAGDPVTRLLEQKLGKTEVTKKVGAAMAAALAAEASQPANEPARPGGLDLAATLEAAVKKAEAEPELPPTPVSHKPGHVIDPGIRRGILTAERQLAPLEEALARLAEAGALSPEQQAQLAALTKVREALRHPRFAKLDPEYLPLTPPSQEPVGPGACLVDRDLSHHDLSGRDLSGADLSHALLIGADLRGASLRGAKLHRAVLFKAELEGADLTGADLSSANCAGLRGPGLELTGAELSFTFFHGARLPFAKLVGARGAYTYLVEANLEGANLSKARLEQPELSRARLVDAKLTDAELDGARLDDADATRADLTRARFAYASFERANLTASRMRDARGSHSLFTKAVLDDAELVAASLLSCHFGGTSAQRADFTSANLREARFERAVLDHARFVTANLLRANLSKARMHGARFSGANLYEAVLLGSAGERCDFTGANVQRVTFDPERS